MSVTVELVEELKASYRNVDGKSLTPLLAIARATRILELIKSAPQNRALFLTLAAIALAGAEAVNRIQNG
jgi:hypothetical protein